jgi:uncharacterized membrane protein
MKHHYLSLVLGVLIAHIIYSLVIGGSFEWRNVLLSIVIFAGWEFYRRRKSEGIGTPDLDEQVIQQRRKYAYIVSISSNVILFALLVVAKYGFRWSVVPINYVASFVFINLGVKPRCL